MCDPVTIATVALSGLSAAASFMEQSAAADQEEARQAELYQRTADEADNAYRFETEGLVRRQRENEVARANDEQVANIESMRAKATAKVAAAEGGVAGVSIDALIGDFDRSLAVYRNGIEQSADFEDRQILAEVEGADARRKSRINNASPQGVTRPSVISGAIDFAGAGLAAYGSYKKSQPVKPPTGNTFKKIPPSVA